MGLRVDPRERRAREQAYARPTIETATRQAELSQRAATIAEQRGDHESAAMHHRAAAAHARTGASAAERVGLTAEATTLRQHATSSEARAASPQRVAAPAPQERPMTSRQSAAATAHADRTMATSYPRGERPRDTFARLTAGGSSPETAHAMASSAQAAGRDHESAHAAAARAHHAAAARATGELRDAHLAQADRHERRGAHLAAQTQGTLHAARAALGLHHEQPRAKAVSQTQHGTATTHTPHDRAMHQAVQHGAKGGTFVVTKSGKKRYVKKA